MSELQQLTWWQWLLVAALMLSQATWLFLDARRRGARAWLWGLWGLIQCPTPLVVYWFVVIRPYRRKA